MSEQENKEQLLKALKDLGVHQDGRKVRSDTGKSHSYARQSDAPRSDKGTVRRDYKLSSLVRYRLFKQALEATALRNEDGEIVGEGVGRDENGIFNLNVRNKSRTMTRQDGRTTTVKSRLTKDLEQYRWEWFYAMACECDAYTAFCNMYYIREEDVHEWTYSEWKNAYKELINGWPMNTREGKPAARIIYDMKNGPWLQKQ